MKPTLVIYHRADFDGIFCREIAAKHLPENTEFIGWDFADAPLGTDVLSDTTRQIIIMDLPIDRVFGLEFKDGWACQKGKQVQSLDRLDLSHVVWIDHHKTSIECHPPEIAGYRIDGVAACRLAWQWFQLFVRDVPLMTSPANNRLPDKQQFIDRTVDEPYAVRLAGEYDIWDKRDSDADLFQYGLRAFELGRAEWKELLSNRAKDWLVVKMLETGKCLAYAERQANESIIKHLGYTVKWEGLTFLACNAARFNSKLFDAAVTEDHEALLGFKLNPNGSWSVSLYGVPHRPEIDLSTIAKKYGGGGHKQACGFTWPAASFPPFFPGAAAVFTLPTSNLNFGTAIIALQQGQRVARAGWNGKGMYLWLLPAAQIKAEWCREPHLKAVAEANGGSIEGLASIRMMTADKKVLTGWLASQTDILARDWQIIDPEVAHA